MANKFSNEMTCHVWAQQTQESGESHHGNVYFRGPILYSYGSHFILGIMLPGGRAILNSNSYSITTAKHKGYAWRAVGYSGFSIPELTGIADAILALADSPFRQRTNKDSARRELRQYLESYAARLDDDAGRFLYGLASRGRWEAFKVRALAKAERESAAAAAKAKAAARKDAAELAAEPLDAFRRRMAVIATQDGYRGRYAIGQEALRVNRAHKAAGGPRIKAAVWQRLKIVRAMYKRADSTRDDYGARAQAREGLARLRRVIAGDEPGLNRGSARRVLGTLAKWLRQLERAHMPLRTRQRLAEALSRLDRAQATADRLQARWRAQEAARKAAAWQAGEPGAHYRGDDGNGGAMLRAIDPEIDGCEVRGGTLETSLGAEVPLPHAFRVFRFVKHCRETGQAWREGESRPAHIRAGHFALNSIDESGNFKAGCHRINWSEIERLAAELGVLDCGSAVPAETETVSA
jgi:hypothetical protein